ncbi:MAG: VCBS repeat-containing protein [Planctomycetota bacterium]
MLAIRLTLPILAALLVAPSHAQVFGTPEPVPLDPGWPSSLVRAVGDIDEDGDLDVVVSGDPSSGTEVGVLRNEGNGVFSGPHSITTTSSQVTALLLLDVGNDGDLDVVRSTVFPSSIALLENQGGGVFAPPLVLSTEYAEHLAAGDFDEDGLLDIAGTNSRVWTMRQSPAGGFEPRAIAVDPSTGFFFPNVIVTTDVDGDGHLDLLYTLEDYLSGRDWVQLGDGTGTFAPLYPALGVVRALLSLHVGDLNGDGFDDLIKSPIFGVAGVNFANGTGTYEPTVEFDGSFSRQSQVGDIDGDGTLDVVWWNSREVRWASFDGAGLTPPRVLTHLDTNSLSVIDLADFDGDSLPDLLLRTGRPLPDGLMFLARNQGSIAAPYCGTAVPHSGDRSARIEASGSREVAADELELFAYGLPRDRWGMFICATSPSSPMSIANSQGLLCLGGTLGRFNRSGEVQQSALGTFRLNVRPSTFPLPNAVLPGDTWYFQAWFRDINGGITSNLTDAISITFE